MTGASVTPTALGSPEGPEPQSRLHASHDIASAWTPGPWECERVLDPTDAQAPWVGRLAEQHYTAIACGNDVAERMANGRLIAAAPSLYADAEFLCARIRELEGEMRDDDELSSQYFGHVLPAVARMESGLAEARGEQP